MNENDPLAAVNVLPTSCLTRYGYGRSYNTTPLPGGAPFTDPESVAG